MMRADPRAVVWLLLVAISALADDGIVERPRLRDLGVVTDSADRG